MAITAAWCWPWNTPACAIGVVTASCSATTKPCCLAEYGGHANPCQYRYTRLRVGPNLRLSALSSPLGQGVFPPTCPCVASSRAGTARAAACARTGAGLAERDRTCHEGGRTQYGHKGFLHHHYLQED